MIARVLIGGEEFTDDVLRGGVSNLSSTIEDEEGRLAIGAASVSFCNLNGSFNDLIADPPEEEILISMGSRRAFVGHCALGGFSYDPDDARVDINLLALENKVIEKMQAIRPTDLSPGGLAGIQENKYIARPGWTASDVRVFFNVSGLIELILSTVGIGASHRTLPPDENLWIGGVALGMSTAPRLPCDSCYDLFREIVKILNGVWWINPAGHFSLYRKRDLLPLRAAQSAVPLEPIRGSVRVTDEYYKIEKVSFEYSNSDLVVPSGLEQYPKASLTSCPVPRREKSVQSVFQIPTPVAGYPYLTIEGSDLHTSKYLIQSPRGGTLHDHRPVAALTILQNGYAIDLKSDISLDVEHSILDDESFFANWPMVYSRVSVPGAPEGLFFVRSAEADLEAEKVRIQAIRYELD